MNKNDTTLKFLTSVFSKYSALKKAYLFGSRARGDFKHNSDYDIAIEWKGTELELAQLMGEIEENKPQLNTIDCIEMNKTNPWLAEVLKKEGKLIYEQ